MTDAGVRESPFATGKWEYEHYRHLYYLDSKDFHRLAHTDKHCFVVGHRGTGKTTLLRALDWAERQSDKQLRHALGDDPFSDGIVGCYFKINMLSLNTLEQWLMHSNQATSHAVMGSYIRSLWLEEIAIAAKSISTTFDDFTLASETEALKGVANTFHSWLPDLFPTLQSAGYDNDYEGEHFPLTMSTLQRAAALVRDQLWNWAVIGSASPEQAAAALKLNRFQQLTNAAFHCFGKLLNTLRPDRLWTFRVCMDEGEYLSEPTRTTIRTLVRECESPLFIVVAALSDLGIDTLYPGVSLTNDDRHILNLDKRRAHEMRELINGVVRARLAASAYEASRFSVQSLLGQPDLNDLLLELNSENRRFRADQSAWRTRSTAPDSWRNTRRGWSPIRQYLQDTASIPASAHADRAEDSAGYRKKKVAGYLQLLSEYGIERPLYAGTDIAVEMAANSVRNLLLFLEETRLAWVTSLKEPVDPLSDRAVCDFIALKHVPYHIQDKGLERLGEAKWAGFEERVIYFTSYAKRLVDLVGKVTHHIDFGSHGEPIRTPDQGRLRVRLDHSRRPPMNRIELEARPHSTKIDDVFLDILHECHEEGFLRLVSYRPANGEVEFEMNRSLARFFAFSYHVPSYSRRLDWGELSAVFTRSGDASLDRIALRALRSDHSSGAQMSLPDS